MTKIDIGELHRFADTIKTENEKALRYVEQLKEAIQNYINDTTLKGKAIDASQTYFFETYLALCDSIIEAIPISSEKLPRYIQDFHDQVDPSYNAVVDADGLAELDQQIDRLERRMEDIQRKLGTIGTGSNQEGQLNQLRAQVTATYKKEQMKEKLLAFENSHADWFCAFRDLGEATRNVIRELEQNVSFDERTKSYNFDKINTTSIITLHETLYKTRGIDPAKVKELQDYQIYAVVYYDSEGEPQVMWMLEQNGKAVRNYELIAYLDKAGKYLSPDKYEVLTLDQVEDNILEGWKDGEYYLDGKKISGVLGSTVKASAYVQSGAEYVNDSGLYDIVVGLGLSAAAIRGSKVNPKLKLNYGENLENHLVNVEGVSRKGIQGGHNINSFNNELKRLGVNPSDCIIDKKLHPNIDGVYEVTYQLPKKDMSGKLIQPLEYRKIKDPKTVYDPKIISNEKMIKWGKEAMENGKIDGRMIEGRAENGLKFRGWLDQNGNVTNFYPVLK